MVDRTTREAIALLGQSLKRVFLCLSDEPTRLISSPQHAGFWRFTFIPEHRPVPLRLANVEGKLFAWLRFDVTVPGMHTPFGAPRAAVVAYRAEILDRHSREMLAYHWHPIGESNAITPHLHLSFAGRDEEKIGLQRAHLPTGVVSPAAIVRFLIEELGVEPNRADWDRVLAAAEAPG